LNRRANGWDVPAIEPKPTGLDEVRASLLQKLGLPFFVFLGGALLCVVLYFWTGGDLRFLNPGLLVALALAAGVMLAMAARDVINYLERATGVDLDRDGDVGLPGSPFILLNARKQEPDPEAKLKAQALEFLRGCEVDTSARRWEPVLGRQRYQQWRDALMKAGFAEWLNPQQQKLGWRLKVSWQEIVKHLG